MRGIRPVPGNPPQTADHEHHRHALGIARPLDDLSHPRRRDREHLPRIAQPPRHHPAIATPVRGHNEPALGHLLTCQEPAARLQLPSHPPPPPPLVPPPPPPAPGVPPPADQPA